MDDLRDGGNARGADFKLLPFKKLNLKDTGWHSILIGGVHPHRQATSMSPHKRPSSSRLHDLLQSPRCVHNKKCAIEGTQFARSITSIRVSAL